MPCPPQVHEIDLNNSAPWDHRQSKSVTRWARARTQMTMILLQVSKLVHQTFQTLPKQILERAVSANARDNYLPVCCISATCLCSSRDPGPMRLPDHKCEIYDDKILLP